MPCSAVLPVFCCRRSDKTRTRATATTVAYTLTDTDTNATFAAELCTAVSAVTLEIYIAQAFSYGVHRLFQIPSCVSTATALSVFNAQYLILEDFSVLPQSLASLSIAVYYASPSGSRLGFDTNDEISWSDLWTHFPNLSWLSLTSGNLRGILPQYIPTPTFIVSDNELSGTVPPSLFNDFNSSQSGTQVMILLNGNSLTGPLPDQLFANGLPSQYVAVSISFTANQMSGTIPQALLYSISNQISVSVYLNGNSFQGTLPDRFVPSTLFASGTPAPSLYLGFSQNMLSGPIPDNFIGNVSQVSTVAIYLAQNRFTSLPSTSLLSPTSWTPASQLSLLMFDLSDNQLTGTIPATLLTAGLTSNATYIQMSLTLSGNPLSGGIPANLFYKGSGSSMIVLAGMSTYLYMEDMSLDSPLPSGLFAPIADKTSSVVLSIKDNPSLTGSIPDALFSVFQRGNVQLNAQNSSISGSPPTLCLPGSTSSVSFVASQTLLSGSIPASWSACAPQLADLDNCPSLHSAIPSGLLTQSNLLAFTAQNTPLSGTLPQVGAQLKILNLNATDVVYCSSSSKSAMSNAVGLSSCNLDVTACGCASSFPMCPNVDCPCPNATKPNDDFVCVGGVWTASSTNATTLTLPPNAGQVLITGNLTSSSVVFTGLGSTLNVTGYTVNLMHIVIVLTPSEASSLGGNKPLIILISSGSSGNISTTAGVELSAASVTAKVTSGCKKVKAQKVTFDNGKTLGVYLSLDNSGCNTWWIILVSVVVGVIVLAAIVLVLLVVFCKPFREKVRPYSAARRNRAKTVE